MEYCIKIPNKKEILPIAEMHHRVWHEVAAKIYQGDLRDQRPLPYFIKTWTGYLSEPPKSEFNLAAYCQGEVIGIARCGRLTPDAESILGQSRHTGEVIHLYVEADHRNAGVAHALLHVQKTLLFGAGYRKLCTFVNDKNLSSFYFFQKYDFQPVTTIQRTLQGMDSVHKTWSRFLILDLEENYASELVRWKTRYPHEPRKVL
jgi:GNAT superfamily N-acetyltransferase